MKISVILTSVIMSGLLASCASTSSPSAERVAVVKQLVDDLSFKAADKLSYVSTADASQCYTNSLTMQLLVGMADSPSTKSKFGGAFITKVWKNVVDSRPDSERKEAATVNQARREALKTSEASLSSKEKIKAMTDRMVDCSNKVSSALKELSDERNGGVSTPKIES